MKGSGKQVLLRILEELSTRVTPEADMDRATQRLRAGLLLHGSTADESYERSSEVAWASQRDSDGALLQQGMAVGDNKIFLTQLYDAVFSMNGLKEHVLKQHPKLSPEGFEAFEWLMWLLVSAVQMYPELVSIEGVDELDVDEWVKGMSRHYESYFDRKRSQGSND